MAQQHAAMRGKHGSSEASDTSVILRVHFGYALAILRVNFGYKSDIFRRYLDYSYSTLTIYTLAIQYFSRTVPFLESGPVPTGCSFLAGICELR